MNKRIVITGIGIVGPCCIGKNKFWDFLKKGESAVGPITLFSTSGLPCKLAGELSNFKVRNFISHKGLRNLTRNTQFALAASKLALNDAHLPSPVSEEVTDSYGVSLGSATGSIHSIMEFDRQALIAGPRSVNPPDFPNTALNTIASHISIRFNIKGFNATLSNSFSSSLDSIFYAGNMIKNYGYKVVLAGGAEELTFETFIGFIKLKCLSGSEKQKTKEINCPYDRRRNGIIFGEGACILVLEDLRHAIKRKAKIYAELKGYGFCFDPAIIRGTGVTADGAAEAIRQAISESGYPPSKIDYIVGSANSTQRFDAIEAKAIKLVFKEKTKEIPVSSIKSMIGETFSVGGAFNVAAALGALEKNFIPQTINYRSPDKRCDLNIIANRAVRKKLNNILIDSFSHNGHNSSIIIGRPEI